MRPSPVGRLQASWLTRTTALAALLVLLALAAPASAAADPDIPEIPLPSVPGFSDCKESPTPDAPDRGIAGFFTEPPATLPRPADPFAPGATTTIFEQYGYAGLRWRTYDLGCGPDAVRQPDAVIGTAVSNWTMQAPIALTALTGSLTQVAFQPTFLGAFDPVIERVSAALHQNLFASWIPAVVAALGVVIIFKAHRQSLATTAAGIGWALIVVLLATALFRWPIAAGQAVDASVTGTLGAAVGRMDGHGGDVDPGTAVASHVSESILYKAWVAGTLGSPDSETARRYGPALFKAQALSWHEAAEAQANPDRAREIIEAKKAQWEELAGRIQAEDPEAYEYLTGARSESRVGYAILSALGVFLSLPFLLLSSLLMLGCFLVVRLAVMMFPAFAVLGAFPASRNLVLGLGRTVGAAVINAVIFGIGAGVTVAVLGILFHPGGGAPPWLSLVLMPLFSFVMWAVLTPFRRLTTMVSPDRDYLASAAGSFGETAGRGRRLVGKAVALGASSAGPGVAVATAQQALAGDRDESARMVPDRAEARPAPPYPPQRMVAAAAAEPPLALDPGGTAAAALPPPPVPASRPGSGRHRAPVAEASSTVRPDFFFRPAHAAEPATAGTATSVPAAAVSAPAAGVPDAPAWLGIEALEVDGEEVYPIFRPTPDDRRHDDRDGDAA